ncbi:glycoside hydrolase superfamily [Cerioporus squamosus]|nr:glycoside hydrolase superfamily [Cerioporus squamosus]
MATRRLVSALTVLSLSAWRGYATGKFDISRSDNIASYWGQLSSSLSDLCKNDDVNIIPIGFMTDALGAAGHINLAGNCKAGNLPNSELWDCKELAKDIQDCQKAGKIVTLSLGGATGSFTFSSEDEAKTFGETFYKNFLGGNSSTRPFGPDVVLDGMDLDLESKGTYQETFVNHTLEFAKQQNDDKKYYITGAPQCYSGMDANMENVLYNAPFDAIFVQFYNNPDCELKSDADLGGFNFEAWVEWARGSINKDVKVYIGAPGSSSAAGTGYVDSATLAKYIDAIHKNATAPSFGGVMLWDAGSVAKNTADPDFLHNVKKALTDGGSASPSGGSSAVPSGPSGSASAPVSSATTFFSATDGSATATSGTGDSSATAASGSASTPGSTTMEGSSAVGSSATPTSGTADGPAATTTATSADGSQTTAQTSTPTGSPGDDGDGDSDDSDCEDEDGDGDGDESSQAAGATATATSDAPASATCTPAPSDCAGIPDWQKTQAYEKCKSVRFEGKLYQASSWVTSNEPGTIDVWKLVGTCPGSTEGSSIDSSASSSSTAFTESTAASVTESFPASFTDSSTLSSTDSFTLSSADSSTLPSIDSSTLSAAGSSTVSSTESFTTSSAGSALSNSQSGPSSVQPERRLFGMRARHAT